MTPHMDMTDAQWEAHLRDLWDVLHHPDAHILSLVLGDVQKSQGHDYDVFVVKLMAALDMLDAGQFPSEWTPE